MTHTKTTKTILTCSLAATLAQGGLAIAATDTPQTGLQTPTNGVSTVNGQLVKVGDQHEYSYDLRRWNVSSNPLGWIFGAYGISASYGFHPNFALRADVNYVSPLDSKIDGFEFGVGAPIYFRRLYNGFYLEPGFIVRRLRAGDSSATTVGPQVLAGWHWSWDSGLNIALAFGGGHNFSSNDQLDSGLADDKVFANGYLRFGYSF